MNWIQLLNNNRLRQSKRQNKKDARNDFESDLGRIIFSPAVRRMHDKTQVFPLTSDDNIHSRLTHSMEVMSVGYSLGVKLCESENLKNRLSKDNYELFREIPVILKNSCLIHDIGNPPFGHFGETVIQNYFSDFFKNHIIRSDKSKFTAEDITSGKLCLELNQFEVNDFKEFDGNAQGLRVLTKLQILNDCFGLNLTYATLASYIKYPNYNEIIKKDKLEKKKRGIFQSEKEYYIKIAKECGLMSGEDFLRHPLCYLMEAADSICYLAMDIEDGFNKKIYDIDYLYEIFKEIPSIKKKIIEIYEDKEKFYKNVITQIVNFRIKIIQTLVDLAFENFEKNIDEIENGNYKKELIFDDANLLAKKLQQICVEKIFKSRDIVSLEITGHSVITGLLDYYINFVFHKDEKYKERVANLISDSIIRAAIEENIEIIWEKRINEYISALENPKEISHHDEIKKVLSETKSLIAKYREIKEQLNSDENINEIEKLEIKKRTIDCMLKSIIKPKLDDLNDYYKLRVIVDFITGMTDQYALNHFQKISGQKII